MRDDVLSFELRGPVLDRVRERARQAGISERQLVEDVLGEVLEPGEATAIVALDAVEEEGEFALEREPGEGDDAFRARNELYGSLFRSP